MLTGNKVRHQKMIACNKPQYQNLVARSKINGWWGNGFGEKVFVELSWWSCIGGMMLETFFMVELCLLNLSCWNCVGGNV
jgi:hypothetical protein